MAPSFEDIRRGNNKVRELLCARGDVDNATSDNLCGTKPLVGLLLKSVTLASLYRPIMKAAFRVGAAAVK